MQKAKIGIITILYAENYGAVLQCYALKEKLKEIYGENVTVIDYCSPNDRIGYGIFYNTLLKKHHWKSYLKYLIKIPFVIQQKIKRKKVFNSFRKTFICPKNSDFFDIIFYGSDQIWAYSKDFGGYNPVYWGEKYNSKVKMAYSASMGQISHVDDNFIRKHISNFNYISVREDDLKVFITGFTDKVVIQTLDPTLLLNKTKWNSFCYDRNLFDNEYILVYNLNDNSIVKQLAIKLSNETSLNIVEILGQTSLFETLKRKSTFSPEEFVSLFKYATYIVTSSFHGTVFSLIFHKNFWVSQNHNSKRVENLLSSFRYNDRFVTNDNVNVLQPIDYNGFENKLEVLRKTSELYLKNAIDYLE